LQTWKGDPFSESSVWQACSGILCANYRRTASILRHVVARNEFYVCYYTKHLLEERGK